MNLKSSNRHLLSQVQGTKSTLFLTYLRKEQSGLRNKVDLGTKRTKDPCLAKIFSSIILQSYCNACTYQSVACSLFIR